MDRAEQEALVRHSCATLPADEWRSVPPDALEVSVLSGAMTNAMFICRVPAGSPAAIVRIFGKLGALVDRALEMAVFDCLAKASIGPGMLGVIYNDGTVGELELAEDGSRAPIGRIEEFLDGWTTLGAEHYQCQSSRHLMAVAAKLARCHKIEMSCASREARILKDLELQSTLVVQGAAEGGQERWRSLMSAPIDIFAATSALIKELKAIRLDADDICFCHNDLQHGNVLMKEDGQGSQHYTFIDFEYAGYNPIYYDMANIWCEVPANYTDFSKDFPSEEVQRLMSASYLRERNAGRDESASRDEAASFVEQCKPWIRASHLFWGLWGILQSRDRSAQAPEEGEFDYAAYAANRLNEFARLSSA